MYFDPTYLLFILPALALSLWASWRTKATFNKFSQVRTMRGLTGAQAGQEIQHAQAYKPMWLRSILVPTASFGSSASYFVVIGGMLFHSANLVYLGALLFSAVLLFQLVTLPVEFDATARAKRLALDTGIVTVQERVGMDKVLNAAAMTYVAAVASSLMTLLYYLLRASSMSRR